jgi:hypothetical protein
MDDLPFSPFRWPAIVCWIVEQADMKFWSALAVSILLFLISR